MTTTIDKIIAEYTAMQLAVDKANEQLEEQRNKLAEQVAYFAELRPHWAKGFTSDSVAAQTYLTSTLAMWQLLEATTQTEAISKLISLIELKDNVEANILN